MKAAFLGLAAMVMVPAVVSAAPALALSSDVLTELHGVSQPIPANVEAAAKARFEGYSSALKARDYQAAYQMLRLSYQASHPRLEWEMQLRARDGLWADGTIRMLRVSWHQDPAGQPSGLYAAYDFRGDRSDGGMDCGYVAVHKAADDAEFTIVRTDTSFVPAHLMKEGVPDVAILRELPCFLGKGIATAI